MPADEVRALPRPAPPAELSPRGAPGRSPAACAAAGLGAANRPQRPRQHYTCAGPARRRREESRAGGAAVLHVFARAAAGEASWVCGSPFWIVGIPHRHSEVFIPNELREVRCRSETERPQLTPLVRSHLIRDGRRVRSFISEKKCPGGRVDHVR